MSKYTWILDFGHGGIDKDGNYTTEGKKQYHFTKKDGSPLFSIYEGQINREIGYKLASLLEKVEISYEIVSDKIKDTALSTRVKRANAIYKEKNKKAIFVSLHSNAASATIQGTGSKANGYEIFTSVGQTKSDQVAEVFMRTYMTFFKNVLRSRADESDGDLDKEAQFYVLKNTHGPAILVENLFYDNKAEAKYLLSKKGQDTIALCLLNCIQNYEETANNSFNSEIE